MRTFTCRCGNTLHFENSRCLNCGRTLGFMPEFMAVAALEPDGDGQWRALTPPAAAGRRYRLCRNYSDEHVCNWLVPAGDTRPYCRACRLNDVIPDLGEPRNHRYWQRLEAAKRRLLYTLLMLDLPVTGKDEDPEQGLAFRFLSDGGADAGGEKPVLTGHHAGTITINVAEADPGAREAMREKMNETYRTLLGHFRHESGHHYWRRLVAPSPARLAAARALFGDETADYDAALARYYDQGPAPDWSLRHISAYAGAHPAEDWAETWAHYLHMVDTLETARDMGFSLQGRLMAQPQAVLQETQHAPQAAAPRGFPALLRDWVQLTVTMNALNRSMGLPDAYPFVLADPVVRKLAYVHDLVAAHLTGR